MWSTCTTSGGFSITGPARDAPPAEETGGRRRVSYGWPLFPQYVDRGPVLCAVIVGDPLVAVAWLATAARDYGMPLRAGDIVLSGSLGPMVPVAPGDTLRAELTGLGCVHASFTNQTQEAP
jgi:hypothetical protein